MAILAIRRVLPPRLPGCVGLKSLSACRFFGEARVRRTCQDTHCLRRENLRMLPREGVAAPDQAIGGHAGGDIWPQKGERKHVTGEQKPCLWKSSREPCPPG